MSLEGHRASPTGQERFGNRLRLMPAVATHTVDGARASGSSPGVCDPNEFTFALPALGTPVTVTESRRILLVTPASPFDATSGTHQRTHLLYAALRACGEVDVVILEVGENVGASEALEGGHAVVRATAPERQDLRRFVANPALTRAVEHALGRSLDTYDVVVGRYMWAVTQIVVPSEVPMIADLDDFRYRYGGEVAPSVVLIKERTRKAMSHWLGRRNLRRFRAAFFASVRDAGEAGIAHRLLPNVPFRFIERPEFDTAGDRILFVGSLWYRPNRDGVEWLLRTVWPVVKRARPQAILRLVGAAAPELRAQWIRHRGVEAPGFVDDLEAEYARASVVVAPIHSGGGTNIKILEALAYGRACVTTRFCLAAFGDLENGRDLIATDAAADFARACVSLLEQAAKRAALARSGHATVLAHYTRARFDAVVRELVEAVARDNAAVARATS